MTTLWTKRYLDLNNDRRSMERKLPESMYLIVKRNRENQPWQFPQGKLLDSESSLRAVSFFNLYLNLHFYIYFILFNFNLIFFVFFFASYYSKIIIFGAISINLYFSMIDVVICSNTWPCSDFTPLTDFFRPE